MYYTVYKITNLLDGKFYIGKHQTKKLDDGYFGSGKRLKYAIAKHGIENFKKEILEVHQTEEAMNAAEARLVVLSENSYNLCSGGNGGFGYINATITPEKRLEISKKGGQNFSEYQRKKFSENAQKRLDSLRKSLKENGRKAVVPTLIAKKNMSEAAKRRWTKHGKI